MNICIFCSANSDIGAACSRLTEELGAWAADNGHSIVFGGNDSGLMHDVSKTAKEHGGKVIGIVPRIIEERGKPSPYMDVHIPTEDLSDRKALMMAKSDVFIVLPGGVGTLDELFTVVSAAGLGYHDKPVILYNMYGFWDSLIAMMDDLQAKGALRGDWHDGIKVVSNLDEIRDFLA